MVALHISSQQLISNQMLWSMSGVAVAIASTISFLKCVKYLYATSNVFDISPEKEIIEKWEYYCACWILFYDFSKCVQPFLMTLYFILYAGNWSYRNFVYDICWSFVFAYWKHLFYIWRTYFFMDNFLIFIHYFESLLLSSM